ARRRRIRSPAAGVRSSAVSSSHPPRHRASSLQTSVRGSFAQMSRGSLRYARARWCPRSPPSAVVPDRPHPTTNTGRSSFSRRALRSNNAPHHAGPHGWEAPAPAQDDPTPAPVLRPPLEVGRPHELEAAIVDAVERDADARLARPGPERSERLLGLRTRGV